VDDDVWRVHPVPGTVDMTEEFYYPIPRYVVLVRYTSCRSVRPFLWGCATVRKI
jgi:hypothetical protein